MQLRIPGPTPIPPEIQEAMGRQMINHRGPAFAEIINRITQRLKGFFQTQNDLFVLTGSGTGAMEASIVNMLSPGDKVLAVSVGAFGDRFGDIAQAYGANVTRLSFEWGQPADPDAVRQALKSDPGVKAVLVTHNETSTAVTNDLGSISSVVREFDKLLIVDAISSLGSLELPVDKWGCDVVATGSQKGWMVPPGLAMVSVSQKAWQAYAAAKMPRYYWDFGKAKGYLEKGQTPWTPAVSIFYALDVALEGLAREGLANIIDRHARVASKVRSDVKSLGLSLFANEKYASNTVTAIRNPDGFDVKQFLKVVREQYGVVLAGGQAKLDGKIFRIGHLGWIGEKDVVEIMDAVKAGLNKTGFKAK